MGRITGILVILLLTALGSVAHAAVRVEPAVLDLEGVRREEFRFHVTVHNEGPGNTVVFPVTAEVDALTGGVYQPGGPGENHQLSATWVEMPRDEVRLKPGQSKEVPVMVKLNIHAEPGPFHHVIAFVPGTSPDVTARVIEQAPGTTVNILVREDAVERLNLVSFLTPRRVLFGFPSVLTATIFNGGNRGLVPEGRIRLFDRDDREVDSVPFNTNGTMVSEGQQVEIRSEWRGTGFGRYKAVLEMRYGNLTDNAVADSTFFWVIPVWLIVALVSATAALVMLLTYLLHRNVRRHAEQ